MNITLYSLSDYNGGLLIPKTFDFETKDMIDNEDEWRQAIADWLEEVTEERNDGEVREEWIVCDYEDIPSGFVGTYDLDPSFWEYKEAIQTSHYDKEVIDAAMSCDVQLENIDEAYAGEFRSDADFAEDMAEQLDMIPRENSWPTSYIDWEWAARDLMMDYCEADGHYFRCL